MALYTNDFEFASYEFPSYYSDQGTHIVSPFTQQYCPESISQYPSLPPPLLSDPHYPTSLTFNNVEPSGNAPSPGLREATPEPFELESRYLSRGERKIRFECGLEETSSTALNLEIFSESQVPLIKPPVLRLIMLAIWQAPKKRLSNKGIIDAICARFPHLRGVKSWKETVRNALSSRVAFKKMKPKKAHKYLWTFVIEDEAEVFLPLRKRDRKNGHRRRNRPNS